ncbi:MAG: hypothetical protein H5U03_05925 [Clostridia bacterium]|nr:hypothetical protein [Clostridia bacterium]
MKKGNIFSNRKEAKKVYVLKQVLAGRLIVPQAAQLPGLGERQIKRLKGGMKKEGIAFLAHKNRGRKPKHAISDELRNQVISLAANDTAAQVVSGRTRSPATDTL